MTLREELKNDPDPIPNSINNDAHEEINNQIKQFLMAGGKINTVPIGATNDPLATACILNEFTGEPDYKQRRNKAQKVAFERRTRATKVKSGGHSAKSIPPLSILPDNIS